MNASDHRAPVLFLVRGIPGSGKSHFTRALQAEIGGDRAVHLDPDIIDKSSAMFRQTVEQLRAEDLDERFHVYRFCRSLAYDSIRSGKSVIWSQAFSDYAGLQKTVERLRAYASGHGIELPLLVVEVETDPDIARKRILERVSQGGHDVPEDVFERFVSRYESFCGRGYPTVTINGQSDVAAAVSTVLSAVDGVPAGFRLQGFLEVGSV